eukprot:TRINITY_DN5179_c0_g1_i3.p1 TRINITY_DN5179_c0_g1~~TRINITY_DN5179_c0_g1_i3.p1  ORF type:complete len:853 (-),score=157.50 TRINITY_DN5179_c0_g1_i3:69-2306(-)
MMHAECVAFTSLFSYHPEEGIVKQQEKALEGSTLTAITNGKATFDAFKIEASSYQGPNKRWRYLFFFAVWNFFKEDGQWKNSGVGYVSPPFIVATKPATAIKQFPEDKESTLKIDMCFPSSCSVNGGVPVLIKGDGFDDQCRAVFHSLPVSVQVNTENELVCVAPPHPEGIVDLTIVRSNMMESSNAIQFRYDADIHALKSMYMDLLRRVSMLETYSHNLPIFDPQSHLTKFEDVDLDTWYRDSTVDMALQTLDLVLRSYLSLETQGPDLRRHFEEVWHPNDQGYTLLHYASLVGAVPVASALLEKSRQLNRTREYIALKIKSTGDTALHLAIRNNHVAIVKMLLNASAERGQLNLSGVPAAKEPTTNPEMMALLTYDMHPSQFRLDDSFQGSEMEYDALVKVLPLWQSIPQWEVFPHRLISPKHLSGPTGPGLHSESIGCTFISGTFTPVVADQDQEHHIYQDQYEYRAVRHRFVVALASASAPSLDTLLSPVSARRQNNAAARDAAETFVNIMGPSPAHWAALWLPFHAARLLGQGLKAAHTRVIQKTKQSSLSFLGCQVFHINEPQWPHSAFLGISIGNISCFYYSAVAKTVRQLFVASEGLREDTRQGRIGWSNGTPNADLSNLSLEFVKCLSGDLFVILSNVLAQNIDPQVMGLQPAQVCAEWEGRQWADVPNLSDRRGRTLLNIIQDCRADHIRIAEKLQSHVRGVTQQRREENRHDRNFEEMTGVLGDASCLVLNVAD